MYHNEKQSEGETTIWLTPRWLIDLIGPFELDPCAADPRPFDIAPLNFTHFEDGLSLPWERDDGHHPFVFCNPPYGTPHTGPWLERMMGHDHGIALVFARTETRPMQQALRRAKAVFFFNKRITFLKGDPPHDPGRTSGGAPSCCWPLGQRRLRASPAKRWRPTARHLCGCPLLSGRCYNWAKIEFHVLRPRGAWRLRASIRMRIIWDSVSCQLCPLHEGALVSNCMRGEGPDGAEILFVGSHPGGYEDTAGRPFIGKSGQYLDAMLTDAHIDRAASFVTNAVRCRPPLVNKKERTPTPDEINICRRYLIEEVARVRPKAIVALGDAALRALCKTSGVKAKRGQSFELHPDFGYACSRLRHLPSCCCHAHATTASHRGVRFAARR